MNTEYIDAPLLISSPNNGGMLYLHEKHNQVIHNSDVTGFCEYKDGYLLAEQKDGARYIRQVTSEGSKTIALSDSRADLHDLLWDGCYIYAVHTETNEVVWYTEDFIRVDSYRLDGENDSSHMNCIAIYNGRLIASIFGHFVKHRGYKGESLESGKVIDIKTGKTLISGLSQPHSLTVHKESLFLCNSACKELRQYDDFKLTRSLNLSGYTRGLCIHGPNIYVGISKSRNMDEFSANNNLSAAVAVVDLDHFELKSITSICHDEIYDISIADNAGKLLGLVNSEPNYYKENEKILLERDALNKEITLLNERVEYQNISIINRNNSLEIKDDIISELKSDLIDIQNSFSMKITKPLRFIKQRVQRLFNL